MGKPVRPVEADGTYCFQVSKPRNKTCTSAPVPSDSVEAAVKKFEPTPGTVTLFVVRNRWGDTSNRVPVSIDGRPPVLTIPESLIRVLLPPGEHTVAFEWNGKRNARTITARAGEIVFVELVGIAWWWGANYHWAETDSESSKKRASAAKLIADRDQGS